MINLLRSDFYRLFKSRAFYICTIVSVTLLAASIFIMDWSIRMTANLGNENSINLLMPYQDGISYGMIAFSGGDVHLFMAIFIAIFITAEFSQGTMKNVVSKGFSKTQIYLSKVITMTTASFIMIFSMFVFGTLAATFVIGSFGDITGSFLGQMLKTIGIELLLHTALTAIFVMVAMTIRSSGGVIAINIIGVISLSSLIYTALNYLFKNKIDFSQYSLMNNISLYHNMNPSVTGEDFLRSFLVGVAFLAVITIGGIFIFKKADVK